MVQLLIITFSKETSYTIRRLCQEAKLRNLGYDIVLWKELIFDLTGSYLSIITSSGEDIRTYRFIWLGNPQPGSYRKKRGMFLALSRLDDLFLLLVEYCIKHGIIVLNKEVITTIPYYNKLFQYTRLLECSLPIIPTLLYIDVATKISSNVPFNPPYVAKGTYGSKGRNVFLTHNLHKVDKLIKRFGFGKVLIQKYLSAPCDYRVLVLGGVVLGAISRTARKGSFKNNYSVGGKVEAYDIEEDVKELAIRATAVFNADFAGVDIIEYGGSYYVLEVNFFPGFEGFEKATRVNVPRRVLDYLLQC